MKQLCSLAISAALATTAFVSAETDPVRVTGDYVEVRTAEVFTGACILGSEWESLGREAILGWRVSSGSVNGTSLDGLAAVAVVGADRNLGSETLGAPAPSSIRTVLMIDERATAVQREALVAMVRVLAPSLTRNVVELRSVPISFVRKGVDVRVSAAEATLDVTTNFEHSPTCGATQWFDPLATTTKAELGLARSHAWSGNAPGAKWEQTDRKSSFVGTFTYTR
jgi:hypothetical protein